MGEKNKSGLSLSFVAGAVALGFILVGYQTALLIHKASITKIISNRDRPDTVYVADTALISSLLKEQTKRNFVQQALPSNPVAEVGRKVSSKTPKQKAILESKYIRKVENFFFDPNTASLDDLKRLGFSQKQAQSILNYRNKGGRFSRKSDFSKSYVVSDSIYTRLEPYIKIPKLDINLADSTDFDQLPGIGPYFAAKMVEYRRSLGGYSFKEQLMDIYNFDQEKYQSLQDLIILDSINMKSYPIWTLPSDSLAEHPYIGKYSAKAIVLFRENNPSSLHCLENLVKAGIINPEHCNHFLKIKVR